MLSINKVMSKARGRDTSMMICSVPNGEERIQGISHPHRVKVKLWSSLDNNSCHSVGGMRRENKRYTSVTNDEFDDDVLSKDDNITNEADDMQNTDENPGVSMPLNGGGSQAIYGSITSGTELR